MLSPPTFTVTSGSSPRMRGKPSTRGLQGTRRRIIPAHAGQTTSGLPGSVTSSDHPRACGANVSSDGMLSRCTGSSPRMRGKLVSRHAVDADVRIIPAHAGQTEQKALPHIFATDHPRACGANSPTSPSTGRHNGSSPRMRGKQVPHDMPCRALRIIPAHAGQTRRVERAAFLITDHPRACGANVAVLLPPL